MKFWNLKPDKDEPADGVLDIDGEIVAEEGWFMPDGVCIAKDFRAALKGMRNVTVHINSPGGDVMAGAEIYSALREHSLNGEGKVTVIVTALAASAASIVAMAGDRVLMHPVAYMMIHNPWTFAVGDAKEMRKAARTLDEISEGLISAYQTRTGLERDKLKQMLDAETWMSAATCVEKGFADGIYGAGTEAAASLARPTLMSGKAHGIQEILQRMPAEDPAEARVIAVTTGAIGSGCYIDASDDVYTTYAATDGTDRIEEALERMDDAIRKMEARANAVAQPEGQCWIDAAQIGIHAETMKKRQEIARRAEIAGKAMEAAME